MKRWIHAHERHQMTACIERCALASVYLLIAHLMMMHSLHLATGPLGTPAHNLTSRSVKTDIHLWSVDLAGDDVNCAAPTVVALRFEIPLADVELDAITIAACSAPLPLASGMAELVLPRPPGPERQAVLQRFTL